MTYKWQKYIDNMIKRQVIPEVSCSDITISALQKTERHLFIIDNNEDLAYSDKNHANSIPSPMVSALLCELLIDAHFEAFVSDNPITQSEMCSDLHFDKSNIQNSEIKSAHQLTNDTESMSSFGDCGKNKRSQILVIACANGYLVNLFANLGLGNIIGYDKSADCLRDAIEISKKLCNSNAFFIRGEMPERNFADEPFFGIICAEPINNDILDYMIESLLPNNMSLNGIFIAIIDMISHFDIVTVRESIRRNNIFDDTQNVNKSHANIRNHNIVNDCENNIAAKQNSNKSENSNNKSYVRYIKTIIKSFPK